MTVERLEELKAWLQDTVAHLDLEVYYMGISVKDECQSELDDLAELIQAEIDRQKVTDEEVQRTMELLNTNESWETSEAFRVAIQALKDRRPKEPCEWCEDPKMTGGLFHANGNKLYLDEWSYCPNCGAKL